MLKEGTQIEVRYHKKIAPLMKYDEVTDRVIIPTHIPKPRDANVRVLDVTSLSQKERDMLSKYWEEYQEYVFNVMETIFAFEDFVDHTNPGEPVPEIKWRTFKPNQLEEL